MRTINVQIPNSTTLTGTTRIAIACLYAAVRIEILPA